MMFPKINESLFDSNQTAQMNAGLIRKVMEQLICPEFIHEAKTVRLNGGWRVHIEDAYANDFGREQQPHYVLDFGSYELPLDLPDIPDGNESVISGRSVVLKVEYHETTSIVDSAYDNDDNEILEGSIIQNAGILTIVVVVDEKANLEFPPALMSMLIAGFYDELLRKIYPSTYVMMNRRKLRVLDRNGNPMIP